MPVAKIDHLHQPSLADVRLSLIANGYRPVPVNGKHPRFKRWQTLEPNPDHVEGLIRAHGDHMNTGLLTGELVAIDIDAPDSATSERLVELVLDLPGGTAAPCRVGRAPKCLFIFRTTEPRAKIKTPVHVVDGEKCQVEILGIGQQFVAFGTHPDTRRPYEWSNGSPLEIAFADLPEITPETIDGFVAGAAAVLAQQGPPLAGKPPIGPARRGGAETFWTRVNAAALASIERWATEIFPSARQESGTGAWRVTSSDLGRPLEEDISIHPAGVQDFGMERPETPINLVVEYGGAPTIKAAAFWLCERLGLEPADLGWSAPDIGVSIKLGSKKKPPEAANDDEEDVGAGDEFVVPKAPKGGLPDSLCYPPGAVGDFARFITACSRFPSAHLSLVASLALTAGLVGRRYKGPTGVRSNLYIVGLAESGFGKDITMRAAAALADSTSAGEKVSQALFMDDIRSLPGLAGKLRKSPSAVAVIDEFGKFLSLHTGRNVAAHREEIATALMQLTGAPQGYWGGQEKAAGNIPRIVQPCFSIHGVSTPSTFWGALSSGNISEGLLGRLVLIDAGSSEPKKVRRPAASIDDVPAGLSETVNALLGGGGGRWGGGPFCALNAVSEERPHPLVTAEWAPGVDDLFEDFDDAVRGRRNTIDPQYRPILNRVGENAARLALIVAIGCDPRGPVITREIQEWANAVAEHSFGVILRGADDNIADNEKAAEYLRIRAIISRRGTDGVTQRMVVKAIRGAIRKREMEEILVMLRQSGEVHLAEYKAPSGQRQVRFWTASDLPEGAEIIRVGD